MTLAEAIKHAEEVAEKKERDLKVYESINEDRPLFKEEENECQKCAEEHRRLAEWLKDYKRLKEQEPCEDCISRKEVLSLPRKRTYDFMGGVDFSGVDVDLIKELPSVNPQKSGKWIYYEEYGYCSECGYGRVDLFDGKSHNFCTNCGARMVESEE